MKLQTVLKEGMDDIKSDFYDYDKALLLPVKLLRNKSLYQREPDVNVRTRVNGRTGSRTEKDLDRTKRKMQKHGMKIPITIDIFPNGKIEIIDGTHRLLLSQELGFKNIPVRFTPRNLDHFDQIESFLKKHNISSLKFVNVDKAYQERERKISDRYRRMRQRHEEPIVPRKTQSIDDLLNFIDNYKR